MTMNTRKGGRQRLYKVLKSPKDYRVVRCDSKTSLLSLDCGVIDGANCLAYNVYEFYFGQLQTVSHVSVDIPVPVILLAG